MVSDSDPSRREAPELSHQLAEQALSNLVSQFARPLDCLRELVQNSIDAGSPRVEVWVRAAGGVLEIHVDDFGEGMDEAVIDSKLTALFASDKEDDLTRIGKFGIGFTSIFALSPRAVLLRTGRHGEAWELLFHEDRSFDKVRLERPVDGTAITLFLERSPAEVAQLIQECRWILGFWCEHSDTPLTFEDRSHPEQRPAPEHADPFAAFAAGAGGRAETINRPLSLAGDLVVRREEGGVQVLVGLSRTPRYAFYNGGLTLVNTTDEEVLGSAGQALGRYSIKVKAASLEHTLSRDNVIRDERWQAAMQVVSRAAEELVDALLERCVQAASQGQPLGLWHGYLAAEAPRFAARRWRARVRRLPLFRACGGGTLSLDRILEAARRHGGVWLHDGEGALSAALLDAGYLLVEDLPETRTLLSALAPRGAGWRRQGPLRLRRAAEDFQLVRRLERGGLEPVERALLDRAEELLAAATRRRIALAVGTLVGGGWDWRERLVLSADGRGLARRAAPSPRDGAIFVNREHPVYRTWRVAAGAGRDRAERGLAAFGLAQAILYARGGSDRASRRLLQAAAEEG